MSSTSQLPAQDSLALRRQPWQAPTVQDLPRLTELTLQTGPDIPCQPELGGGGSTCF